MQQQFCLKSLFICKRLESKTDNTVKYLYELDDGNHIESVLMEYNHGNTICVSTQVGCKMGCRFCASTIAGFKRNLLTSEILLQVYEAEKDSGRHISGVVLMGIGEPLDNYDNVLGFLNLISCPEGANISLRHVSLSTCGLVPKIYELAKLKLGLTLSISLHATNNLKRSEIMPINNKYDVYELIKASKDYFKETGRRISFEYSLIDGVNDSKGYAKERIRADSAEPKSNDDLKRLGITRILPSVKGKDSVINGIMNISEYFITVNPKCKNTIAELSRR